MTESEICTAVWHHYGLPVQSVERIARGSAALFKLHIDGAPCILKVFQPKLRADSILREVHVTDFLRQNGLAVPEYISCRNGEYYFTQGCRVVILQKFIPGQTREKSCSTGKELRDSAKLLAQIVNVLEHYPYDDLLPCDAAKYGSAARLLQARAAYTDLMASARADAAHGADICGDLQYRIAMIDRVLDAGALVDMNALTVRRSHGDYSVLQLLYDGDEIRAVLDFVNAGRVPVAWELIRCTATRTARSARRGWQPMQTNTAGTPIYLSTTCGICRIFIWGSSWAAPTGISSICKPGLRRCWRLGGGGRRCVAI